MRFGDLSWLFIVLLFAGVFFYVDMDGVKAVEYRGITSIQAMIPTIQKP